MFLIEAKYRCSLQFREWAIYFNDCLLYFAWEIYETDVIIFIRKFDDLYQRRFGNIRDLAKNMIMYRF